MNPAKHSKLLLLNLDDATLLGTIVDETDVMMLGIIDAIVVESGDLTDVTAVDITDVTVLGITDVAVVEVTDVKTVDIAIFTVAGVTVVCTQMNIKTYSKHG